ncbi:MAG: hypothetical protein OES37_00905, partial [Chromatiales bacterium]|nr:hypothetical protein [Chromatiales bacterium]
MHPFIEELKRRHVIRVAVIYMAAGWVLAEVAGFAADTFGAPDWVVQMFTIFILLGFPLVVIGAWAFEMTPQGLKRDTGPAVAGTDEPATDLAAQPGAPAVGMTPDQQAAQAVAVPAGSAPEPTAPPSPAAPPSEQSIAVLPFVNMSSDPEQEYFSDGLSEELLNLLAQIPSLRVAARTSSFSFKGEKIDIPAVADKLKVANVLEGSVRKAGNRVRITAQLIDVTTDTHMWSDTYDRELEDIFAIQGEIALQIVEALKLTLAPSISDHKPTGNMEAYNSYLQGLYQFRR